MIDSPKINIKSKAQRHLFRPLLISHKLAKREDSNITKLSPQKTILRHRLNESVQA